MVGDWAQTNDAGTRMSKYNQNSWNIYLIFYTTLSNELVETK